MARRTARSSIEILSGKVNLSRDGRSPVKSRHYHEYPAIRSCNGSRVTAVKTIQLIITAIISYLGYKELRFKIKDLPI